MTESTDARPPGTSDADSAAPKKARREWRTSSLVIVAILSPVITFAVLSLSFSIFQRKQEAKNPFLKIVNVDEQTTDPEVWGANWPREYESYLRTVDTTRTLYGGSEAMPEQRLDRDPWLRRMYSGYAFSIDFRDRRGHAYMLTDQQ